MSCSRCAARSPLAPTWSSSTPTIAGAPARRAAPTFSEAELRAATEAAHDAGRIVAVHASTAEGMRRAIAAGVDTIEHGYGGTPEIFRAMHDKGIVLCPTLAAGDAIARYRGWDGKPPAPAGLEQRAQGLRRRARREGDPLRRAATSACSRTATTRARWS